MSVRGRYSVQLTFPGDLEVMRGDAGHVRRVDGGILGSPFADGLLVTPSVQVVPAEEEAANGEPGGDFILQWVQQPAANAWQAIRQVVDDVGMVAFPQLFEKSADLDAMAFLELGSE